MKRIISFIAIFSLLVSMSACGTNGYYENGYAAGYDDGYSEAKWEMTIELEDGLDSGYDTGRDEGYSYGYDDGYCDGFEDGENELSGSLDWELSKVRKAANSIFGLSPYEAVQILTNYADDPAEVSEDDLVAAIGAISYYYEYSNSAIYDLIE